MRVAVAAALVMFSAQSCLAWHEGGHHLIAVMAFEQLTPDQQRELIQVLGSHPRFKEDFELPNLIDDDDEATGWLIGRAGYWPDIARRTPLDRPTWHYQLGASLTIGDPINVPARPGPVPPDATLDTQEMYIAQAIGLCRKVWQDKTRPAADRALAVCWLIHLAGDAHQPCHAGSFYSPKLFPEGDRGANFISTIQSMNMHVLWDSLLGPRFDAADLRRREREIRADRQLIADALQASRQDGGLDPLTWLGESSEFARSHVYTMEVLAPIKAAEQGASPQLEILDLSEAYLTSAGKLARRRAAFAAFRLAAILREGL